MELPAIITEVMRLYLPSLRNSESGICEPVRITGFSKFSNINESADAENYFN